MAKTGNSFTLPLDELTAVNPLDGRYRNRTADLAPYFSEFALIKTRIELEIKYLIALSDFSVIRKFSQKEKSFLNSLIENFAFEQAKEVKQIEETTRHDVKAMEKALRKFLKNTSLKDILEKIHMGLTSEDINNISYRLMIKRATDNICIPTLKLLINEIAERAEKYKSVPMLARTHGQPAVPTTIGKEFSVFALRLAKQLRKLKEFQLSGKLTGAVGNFNALHFTFPKTNWISFSKNFVKSLGLEPNLTTTQINTHEDLVELFQNYQRINNILIDFNQDMWRYISDNWFIQEVKKGEVGSSTMPQKVNPIDFENSEGNLGLANSLIDFFTRKLAVSRLQRDLSDSTVIRNMGVVMGYSLLAYKSTLTGFKRTRPHIDKISEDLNKDWIILGEGVQTLLRNSAVDDPYSLIASLTRGQHIGKNEWQQFINNLPIDVSIKNKLNILTPSTYLGLAVKLTNKAIQEIKNIIK